MNMRQITPTYFVSPQIDTADFDELAKAGISRVICNRPDAEIGPDQQHETMQEAAASAGIDFAFLPLTHSTMTPDNVQRQSDLIASADGPVLAYCASGTRSSVVWALSQARTQSPGDILAATKAAGYDLDGLRPTLEALSQQG
ncbi:Beta-lactamase hydrolase-like protein (plasmid) [Pseudoseohaeicola sp. NH-UV-7]|uniref:TIGR01244 family sulfur transferase n=1 Tax=unclassified Sulfitobacter TaxID=196795 RepID=UPI000E0C78F2|nr:TIGR01244 family sulfur transferase [Sulfitobacter sp. JL08]AXI54447.1 TIGR01244 family phosphatase [Sulfitobacter sp. JL08]